MLLMAADLRHGWAAVVLLAQLRAAHSQPWQGNAMCWGVGFPFEDCCNLHPVSRLARAPGRADCWSGVWTFTSCMCLEPRDCVGAWSTCGTSCTKEFSVSATAQNSGQECAAVHGEVAACLVGDGACPASGRSCNATSVTLSHGRGGECNGRQVMPHGEQCAVTCDTGYAFAGIQPRCFDGNVLYTGGCRWEGDARCWNATHTFDRCCSVNNSMAVAPGDTSCWSGARRSFEACRCAEPEPEPPVETAPTSFGVLIALLVAILAAVIAGVVVVIVKKRRSKVMVVNEKGELVGELEAKVSSLEKQMLQDMVTQCLGKAEAQMAARQQAELAARSEQMKQRMAALESREAARAAVDPFGLDDSHAAETHAAQALDLWETEALLALSDSLIPQLPTQEVGVGRRKGGGAGTALEYRATFDDDDDDMTFGGGSDSDDSEGTIKVPAPPPADAGHAIRQMPVGGNPGGTCKPSAAALLRRVEVLSRREKMSRLAAALPATALPAAYQQELRLAIERRAGRRENVRRLRAGEDVVKRELGKAELIASLRSKLSQQQPGMAQWEARVSTVIKECAVAEELESEMLLELEAAEDTAEIAALAGVKAGALTRSTVRKVFDSLDTDGNGTLDREEVGKAGQTLGQSLTSEELDTAMQQMDNDGDGSVDFKEFLAFWVSGGTRKVATMEFQTPPPPPAAEFDSGNELCAASAPAAPKGTAGTDDVPDVGDADADATNALSEAVVGARDALWQRRCDHRVGLRRTLQRWQTTRTAGFVAAVRAGLSRDTDQEALYEIIALLRRHTASRHLTRNALLSAGSAMDGELGSIQRVGGNENDQVDDIQELRRQQEEELKALRASQEAERSQHADQLKAMKAQLSEMARQAALAAVEGEDDEDTAGDDDTEAGDSAVREAEQEMAEVAATQTKAIAAAENDLRLNLDEKLVSADLTDAEKQRLLGEYEEDKAAVLGKMSADQATQRAKMMTKLEAKKKAAAEAKAARAAAAAKKKKKMQLSPVAGSGAGGRSAMDDVPYEDVAKSIVSEYNKQLAQVTSKLGSNQSAGKAKLEARLAKRRAAMESKMTQLVVALEGGLEKEGISAKDAVTVAGGLARLKRKARQNIAANSSK